jgi:RNase H-fold protein (predicted Holliday junction resolvase)
LKKNKMPRVLAIDYGQKRTGIAVTDEMQIIASGLTTIPVQLPFPLKIILRRRSSSSYW